LTFKGKAKVKDWSAKVKWQNMILNLLKRFNDALLNDSVDFATCHTVTD